MNMTRSSYKYYHDAAPAGADGVSRMAYHHIVHRYTANTLVLTFLIEDDWRA